MLLSMTLPSNLRSQRMVSATGAGMPDDLAALSVRVYFDYGYSPNTVASLSDNVILIESTPKPKFLEQVRSLIRTKHYGL